MKIIIAGAGDVGFHLAKLLAYEKHDIMVVDLNEEKLRNLSSQLDVGTLKGNSTSYQMLEEAGVERADLFIAVTSFEDTNITSAFFANHLGAKRTIARVKNNNHVDPRERSHLKKLGIDEIISTENLASKEIRRLLTSTAFTDFFQFEGGKLNLLGTVLDKSSPMLNQTLKQCSNLNPDHDFITVAILRNGKTIIPHGETVFEEGDHVYFIATPTGLKRIQEMSCTEDFRMKNIMILGGTEIGYMTALTLSNAFNVKIIEENKARSFELSDLLPNALVVCGDGRDRQFCRTYAEQSVRQAGEARRLDCGFTGSRWSSSRVRQAQLCENIGPREAAQLLRARARQLDSCRGDAGGGFDSDQAGLNCRAYARQSVQQARAARRLDCGYDGARWSLNFRAHLRWCQQVPARESAAELRLRDDFLYRCE